MTRDPCLFCMNLNNFELCMLRLFLLALTHLYICTNSYTFRKKLYLLYCIVLYCIVSHCIVSYRIVMYLFKPGGHIFMKCMFSWYTVLHYVGVFDRSRAVVWICDIQEKNTKCIFSLFWGCVYYRGITPLYFVIICRAMFELNQYVIIRAYK